MKFRLLGIFLLAFCACTSSEELREKGIYFDLNQYFKQEVLRLNNSKTVVDKTVFVNGEKEQKQVRVKNWIKEFEIFTDADINKASWRGLFKSSITPDMETYTSNDQKIPVKKLVVGKSDGKVRFVKIYIENNNGLYRSHDSLSYFPDSLYQIKKTQKIKLLDQKTYEIIGRLKQ